MSDPTVDFSLLQLDAPTPSALNRRALWWLVGMLVLVTLSIGGLGLFLRTVEAEEDARRQTSNAQWLDQTLRFHLRRLESDLSAHALRAQQPQEWSTDDPRTGQIWRTPGIMTFQGWLPADQSTNDMAWPPFRQTLHAHPGNAPDLQAMLDTTRHLQRTAYAGPLRLPDGSAGPELWLAVPLFEKGQFIGDYVATLQLDKALESLIPDWFRQYHSLQVHHDQLTSQTPPTDSVFDAPIRLPGAHLSLLVQEQESSPPQAPRVFFGIALLCLGGMLVALYSLRRDIARRQRVESQLQTQIALRMAMEQSVTLGLRAWGLNGHLLYVNQAFCRMVGLSATEIMRPAAGASSYWPTDQGREFDTLQKLMCDPPGSQTGFELSLIHRTGQRLDVLLHGAPLVLANGQIIGWMDSVLDITGRKRTERLAARQQEMLEASGRLIAVGEVASTLAHELNQPLGALNSFANGLLNRLQHGQITLDEITPVVERMERLADKAGRVIQRVNAFARRQEMSPQPLELVGFIHRVARQVPLPDGVSLQIHALGEHTLPADALLLEHALHNVVLNATEWAATSGHIPARVRVSLLVSATQLGVRVEDTGPGVAPAQQSTLFDAFSSAKTGGMGMGLSICRSIIEAHHGRIEVARSAELGGAQFTLWLPLAT